MAATRPKEMQERGRMEAPLRGPGAFDAAKGLSNALFPRISPSETRQVFWLRGLRMKKV
jgi:hypothetical protein